jgi:hypothetical protein
MLAKDVNDDAGCQNARIVWTSIASKLAPTGGLGVIRKNRYPAPGP